MFPAEQGDHFDAGYCRLGILAQHIDRPAPLRIDPYGIGQDAEAEPPAMLRGQRTQCAEPCVLKDIDTRSDLRGGKLRHNHTAIFDTLDRAATKAQAKD